MVAGKLRFRGAPSLVLTISPVDLHPTIDFAAGTAAGMLQTSVSKFLPAQV